jgi:hypothetical protein
MDVFSAAVLLVTTALIAAGHNSPILPLTSV